MKGGRHCRARRLLYRVKVCWGMMGVRYTPYVLLKSFVGSRTFTRLQLESDGMGEIGRLDSPLTSAVIGAERSTGQITQMLSTVC